MELKDILKNLREQKQVSMDKMCEDLYKQFNMPLAKSTVSKWENGDNCTSATRNLTQLINKKEVTHKGYFFYLLIF